MHRPLCSLGVAGLLVGILACTQEVESERGSVDGGGADAHVRETAVESDRVLAERGDAAAQGRLADAYWLGRGVEQDYGEALRWARLAAEQRDGRGQALLGAAYYNGRGVEQDYGEALRWIRLAAEQGDAHGQSLLGAAYYNGHGVEQDYGEAARWARLAAEQGDAGAQVILGVSYLNGAGVEQDDVSAYVWLTLAASGIGIQGASELRDRLARRMTPEQIAEAQARARAWERDGDPLDTREGHGQEKTR